MLNWTSKVFAFRRHIRPDDGDATVAYLITLIRRLSTRHQPWRPAA